MSVHEVDKLSADKFSKRLELTIFSWIVDVKDRQRQAKLNVTSRWSLHCNVKKINFVNDEIRR